MPADMKVDLEKVALDRVENWQRYGFIEEKWSDGTVYFVPHDNEMLDDFTDELDRLKIEYVLV